MNMNTICVVVINHYECHKLQAFSRIRNHSLTVDMSINTICVVVINHYECHKLQAFSRIRNYNISP